MASPALRALTVAALALPGLLPSPVRAEGDEFGFQYGRYEESGGPVSRFRSTGNSIHVDSLQASGSTRFFDRLKVQVNYSQDTWSGATPITTAPASAVNHIDNISGASVFWDVSRLAHFDPAKGVGTFLDAKTFRPGMTHETVQVMASASPETRKQGDLKLSYEWNEAALDIGGGNSIERDYNSRFFNLGGRLDFNQKLTSLTLGLSYTDSIIDSQRFSQRVISTPVLADTPIESRRLFPDWSLGVHDSRQDMALNLGLTQVLDKKSLLAAGFSYSNASGYQSNPYKESLFFAPLLAPQLLSPNPDTGLLSSLVFSQYDHRPQGRDQFTWSGHYVRHFDTVDGALHLDYRFFHDNWGINAHTFEAAWGQPFADGWIVTPKMRYYSQSAADFFRPYYVLDQTLAFDDYVNILLNGDRSKLKFPAHFSSDHRLSAFGTISGGLTINKQFAKGVNLEAGIEYYTHAGDFKLGGGGIGGYADFDYYLINAALRVDLSSSFTMAGGHGMHSMHGRHEHDEHSGHSAHGGHAPAGVMFDHMLDKADGFMVGYRYMYSLQDGDMLHGAHSTGDAAIVHNACGGGCSIAPQEMAMHMHMLDLMYAPTDWLNLMLMPQFMDMDMTLRRLQGGIDNGSGGHHHGGGSFGHETGGVGDTGMYALFKLYDAPGHHVHMSLGLSAPTGSVNRKIDGGEFIHYGMQLGSGTWDFKPSLTYTGQLERWSWGGQLSGTKRMEDRNESGFAFGDIFQTTAWGSYKLTNWLAASVRGVYTAQGKIDGRYIGPHGASGPMDFPASYGGQYWDMGFGLNATVPDGRLKGNHFGVEWLQPVKDDVHGYQLERDGALSATWGMAF
ncbi:MAG: DUF3570 domain-containing protein [Methylococcaceae bacterium]|nr:MAG: DUF3570 domain-containing protein [Methylococcaceae bacterium]